MHELDIRTGTKLGEFASGDSPHENNYTADGERVFHASIGRVYTPTDRPVVRQAYDTLKGERFFQIVRTDDLKVVESRWDMGKELAEAGYPGMASAVRPMASRPTSGTSTCRCPSSTGGSSSTPRRVTSTAPAATRASPLSDRVRGSSTCRSGRPEPRSSTSSTPRTTAWR